MPSLLECCKEYFETDDLYEVLSVTKKAKENELKRGYHKLSLRVHPDRVPEAEKEQATQKFQTLGKVYALLSDKDKRAAYDDTGAVDEEDDVLNQDRDWFDYWRLLYTKVSVDDINEFEQKYKGSEEEVSDLKSAYCDYKGDMDDIIDNVLCASVDDESRFRKILGEMVKNKELPKYKAFTKEKKEKQTERKRRAEEEAEEAEAARAELGMDNSENSLHALIAQRQQSRASAADDFFAQLEQKYAKPKGKKGASKAKK